MVISLQTATVANGNSCISISTLENVFVSRYSPVDAWLSCDDENVCTHDYFGGPSESDCFHESATRSCDDGDACTSETGTPGTLDVCDTGDCTGIDVDCSDGNAFTGDTCGPAIGCINAYCTSEEYEFATDAEGWTLGGDDWSWVSEGPGATGGYLQGTPSANAVSSPFFTSSTKLRFRLKCLSGDGGVRIIGGNDGMCTVTGEYHDVNVDLGSGATAIQFVAIGSADVLVDRIMVLQEAVVDVCP